MNNRQTSRPGKSRDEDDDLKRAIEESKRQSEDEDAKRRRVREELVSSRVFTFHLFSQVRKDWELTRFSFFFSFSCLACVRVGKMIFKERSDYRKKKKRGERRRRRMRMRKRCLMIRNKCECTLQYLVAGHAKDIYVFACIYMYAGERKNGALTFY